MTLPAPPDPAALLAGARRELARLPAILGAMLTDLDDALWRARPAPKEWSPVEIVCHLRDEEVEDFGARVRAILDGAQGFARIDPERWAVERRYHEAEPRAALAGLLERRLVFSVCLFAAAKVCAGLARFLVGFRTRGIENLPGTGPY
ncbi:MAG: DinB family protein, partial [candidate division NC10 bacterium]